MLPALLQGLPESALCCAETCFGMMVYNDRTKGSVLDSVVFVRTPDSLPFDQSLYVAPNNTSMQAYSRSWRVPGRAEIWY
jgi:hypothetical protein